MRPSQISRLQKELKRNSEFCSLTLMVHITSDHNFKTRFVCSDSDAHSTTSSASPAQSPSYSHLSDDGSDTELSPGSSRSPVFSFLDLTYWKRYLFIYIWNLQGPVNAALGQEKLTGMCAKFESIKQSNQYEETTNFVPVQVCANCIVKIRYAGSPLNND